MNATTFLNVILAPALKTLEFYGGPEVSDAAKAFLLAVAMQESGLTARYQNSPSATAGPARGWWQFEEGGGVAGVLAHSSSSALARTICEAVAVEPQSGAVWRALEGHDRLSPIFARLLLLTDPHPIPTTADEAWDCYANRLWRPGKPHPETWAANWQEAWATVSAERRAQTYWRARELTEAYGGPVEIKAYGDSENGHEMWFALRAWDGKSRLLRISLFERPDAASFASSVEFLARRGLD